MGSLFANGVMKKEVIKLKYLPDTDFVIALITGQDYQMYVLLKLYGCHFILNLERLHWKIRKFSKVQDNLH